MRCVVLAPLFFVSLWCATEGLFDSLLTKGKRTERAGADRAEQIPPQQGLVLNLTKHHPDRNINKRDGNLDDTYQQPLFTDGSQVDDVKSKDAAEIAEEMRSRLKSFEARRQGEAVKSVLKEDDDLSLLDQIDSVLGAPLKKALLEVLDNEIKAKTDKPSSTEKKSHSEKIDNQNNKDYPFYPENSISNQNSDGSVKTSKVDTATRNLASFKTGVGKSRPRTRVLVAASAPLADHNAVEKKGEISASPSQRQASTAAKNPGSHNFIAEKENQKPQTRFLVAPDRATDENRNENDAAVSSQRQQQADVVDKKESIASSLATRGQMSHFQMRYLVAPDAPITEKKARKQEAMADHNAVQKKGEVSAADRFVADRENQKPHTRLLVAPVHAKDAAADVSSRQQTQTAAKKENTASSLTTRGQNSHFKARFFVAPDAPLTEERAKEQDASTSDVADDRNVDESYPELEKDVGNEELDEDLEGDEGMDDDNGELDGDLEMEESRDENDELDEDLEGDESTNDGMELDEDLNENDEDQDQGQSQDVDLDQDINQDVDLDQDMEQDVDLDQDIDQDVDLDQDMEQDGDLDQDGDAEAQVKEHPNRVEQVPVRASDNRPSAFYPEQVQGYRTAAMDELTGAKVDQGSRTAAKAYIAAREKEGTFARRYFVAPDAPISDTRASKKSTGAMVKKSKVDSDEAMDKIPDDLDPAPEDGFDDDDESGEIEKRAWSRKKCDLNCVKDTVMCSNKTQADQKSHVKCGYNPNLKYISVKRSNFTICTASYRLKLSCSRNNKCFYTRGCYGLFDVEYCYHTCDFAYYSKK